MTQAIFYLDDASAYTQTQLWQWIGEQTAHFYQCQQRVYILMPDQAQAHQLDERLWQREPHDFIPHNLITEATGAGSPVEIGWVPHRHHGHRSVLINLSDHAPNFAVTFSQVIDFVPCDDALKPLARVRYQSYRQMGIQLQTASLPKLP